jgi:hypothetical protein
VNSGTRRTDQRENRLTIYPIGMVPLETNVGDDSTPSGERRKSLKSG